MRAGSLSEGKFIGPSRNNSKPGGRVQSMRPERKDSDLYKTVKNLEKEMKEMKEMIKGKVINGHFVEEDVIVDVKFMNAGVPRMMLIDSGAPKSVVSREWIEGYLKDMKV